MVIFVLSVANQVIAGVWPQGKGNGYLQLSFTYLRYHEVIQTFNLENGFEHYGLKRYVNDHTLNGYLEYGLSDRLTFVGTVPYKILSTGDELRDAKDGRYPEDTVSAGNLNTLGNVNLGIRYLLNEGDLLWSAQLMTGLNTSEYEHATGLRSGYDAWYFTPRIQAGKSWGDWYFSASLGYRYKSNGYAHDLVSDNEIGYGWNRGEDKTTWFIFTMGAEVAVTNGFYDDRNSVHTGLYRDEEGFIDLGLKVNHYLNEHLALNLSSIGAIWARHGGNELTYTAGVSWEW